MSTRSIPGFFVALFLGGAALLTASGCGNRVLQSCKLVCEQTCDTVFTCEKFPGFTADGTRSGCVDACRPSCEDFADELNTACDRGVTVYEDAIDACVDALAKLGEVCEASDPYGSDESVYDVQIEQQIATATCAQTAYECK